MTVGQDTVAQWEAFLAENPNIEFVWLQILSYACAPITRIVPVGKFTQMTETGIYVYMPRIVFDLAPGDTLSEGIAPTGSFFLRPDMGTIYCQAGSNGTRAVIQCNCVNADQSTVETCPRNRLQALDNAIARKTGLSVLTGFEVEVVFMKPENGTYTPLGQHSWSWITADDIPHLGLIEDVTRGLVKMGIDLEYLHAESAPGQWEFVLPPNTPLKAVDTLIQARDTIVNIAREAGVRATLHPRPSPCHAGTGAHVHVSLNAVDKPHDIQVVESFFAGLMEHLPSVLAFTLPQEISYARVQSGIWSGGEYASWGWQNKEVPLRRIADNRFELKSVDGLANPYLVLCAILSAGLDGLEKGAPLRGGPCVQAPANLDAKERAALGVTTKLPKTFSAALGAVEEDSVMTAILGDALARTYVGVKRAEMGVLEKMGEEELRNWLIARY